MIINNANLELATKGFNTLFSNAFDATPTWRDRIAMSVPSGARDETYAWLGTWPSLREWLGPRTVHKLRAHGFTIANRDFESTVEVARNDLADDRLGIYGPMFSEMGRAAKVHGDQLVFQLLASGFTTTCFDGQYVFDTDHPVLTVAGGSDSASVSNFGGGAGTPWYLFDTSRGLKPLVWQTREDYMFESMDRPTDPDAFFNKNFIYGVRARVNAGFGLWQLAYASRQTLDAANYAAARAAMMSFKADGGRPLGVMPDVLVVPPALESAGRKLLNTELGEGGASNEWKGTAELIVVPWL